MDLGIGNNNVAYKITSEIPSAEAIYEFYDQLAWNGFLQLKPEQLKSAMVGSFHSIYAYDGDTLIATARLVSDGVINAYLCGLGVLPEYRNKGIAKRLVSLMISKCSECGLHLQFFCEEQLIPFYERMGFQVFAAGMKIDGRQVIHNA